jgi:hypothetical protein
MIASESLYGPIKLLALALNVSRIMRVRGHAMTSKFVLNHWSPLRLLLLAIAAVGLAVMTSTCNTQPREVNVPFETMEKRESPGTGTLYEAETPAIVVVARADDVSTLVGWVSADAKTRLETIDYDEQFALAVFQGSKITGGYNVEVDRIARLGHTVNVYAQFHEPRPDDQRTDVITSPYHLVLVERVDLRSQGVTFNLIVNKAVIQSSEYTMP